MSLQEYINTQRRIKKPTADIAKRWSSRMVAHNWHTQGEAGAEAYLSNYGRGIAAPKCVGLANCAEVNDCPEVALGFWKKAYVLAGHTLTADDQAVAPKA